LTVRDVRTAPKKMVTHAVISPNPAVENTVTVKYSASVCVNRSPKLRQEMLANTRWALANSSRNRGQHLLGGEVRGRLRGRNSMNLSRAA
jgi:hypothetical protein